MLNGSAGKRLPFDRFGRDSSRRLPRHLRERVIEIRVIG